LIQDENNSDWHHIGSTGAVSRNGNGTERRDASNKCFSFRTANFCNADCSSLTSGSADTVTKSGGRKGTGKSGYENRSRQRDPGVADQND